MGKGLIYILVFSILLINTVSASYSCADGTALSQDTEDLDVGESGNANGLFVGLLSSREVVAVDRIEAEIFIDSHTYTLTDNTSAEGELMDGTKYNLTLISSDEDSAVISVNSDNESISEKDNEVVDGYEVYLVSSEGSFPGTASVKLLVGDSKIFIDNKDNSEESVTVNGKKYLVTLFSASNENALIKVFKCNNGDSTVQVIEDAPVVNNTNTNTTVNDSGQNNTVGNNNSSLNETINQTSNNSDSQPGDQAKNYDSTIRIGFIVVLVLALMIFFYLFIRYMKSRAYLRQIEGH